MKARPFNRGLRQFIYNLFAKAQIDSGHARAAFINYGATAKEIFGLSKYSKKSGVRNAIKKWKAKPFRHSRANLAAGLQLARTKTLSKVGGSRLSNGVPTALILITDMSSTSDVNVVTQEANQLKNMGVTIMTIGVGNADSNELKSITSSPQNDLHQSVGSFLDLVSDKSVGNKVINEIKACE